MTHKFNDKNLCWLYKFRSLGENEISNVERIFTHGELYFSPVSKFNDPFDCKPRYEWNGSENEIKVFLQRFLARNEPLLQDGALQEELGSMTKWLINPKNIQKTMPMADAYLRSELDKLGVCCFAEDWSHVLMWSHYAEKHTGICLRFKAKSDTPYFGRAQRVRYETEYPILNPLQKSTHDNLVSSLFHKGDFWRYEKEWRIVEFNGGCGVQRFPLHLLDSVILGMRISQPHEQLIRSWAARMKHKPSVQKIAATENSYGLRLM